jgi:hypothetical protein
MRWLRLYGEFATDAKVQSLSEPMQRRYVMLLCLKCNEEIPGLTDEEVSCALRIGNDEAISTKDKLLSRGLITEEWEPTNWDKRQYISDTSNNRVKKYRDSKSINIITNTDTDTERKPLQKQDSNVTVTLQEKKPNYFDAFWKEYPRKKNKGYAERVWGRLKVSKELMADIMNGLYRAEESIDWTKDNGQYIPHPSTWLNAKGWEDGL